MFSVKFFMLLWSTSTHCYWPAKATPALKRHVCPEHWDKWHTEPPRHWEDSFGALLPGNKFRMLTGWLQDCRWGWSLVSFLAGQSMPSPLLSWRSGYPYSVFATCSPESSGPFKYGDEKLWCGKAMGCYWEGISSRTQCLLLFKVKWLCVTRRFLPRS